MPKQSKRRFKKIKSSSLLDIKHSKQGFQPTIHKAILSAQKKLSSITSKKSNQVQAFHNGARTTLNQGRHK